MQNKKKMAGFICVLLTLLVVCSTPFQQFASIPGELRIFEGKATDLSLTLPANGTIVSDNPDVVSVTTGDVDAGIHALNALSTGQAELQVKLGNMPLKTMNVDVLPDMKVYPGGQSIGVRLNSISPLVVGHHFLQHDGEKMSPGEEADIRIGDMIVSINEMKIKSVDQLGEVVNKAGREGKMLNVELLRGKETVRTKLNPVYNEKEDSYRLGLYIRNSAAGVGTLTFVDPKSKAYGALGHVISDVDTQKPIVVGEGNIVESDVSSIEKGTRGVPGEKFSSLNENKVLGSVKSNTPFGIFGEMEQRIENGVMDKPIPIGLSHEVEQGPAQILTVVEGHKVEKFDIEVVDTVDQNTPATKGLIIKVTDERLLDKTGGIVQGMSGSPIIQDGKLIGAVTHVFVNDPTSGYGCFIEWMLQDAGLDLESAEKPKAS